VNSFCQNPYPLDSFPTSIYAAIREALKIAQTTDVIVGTSTLTALSNAVGCNADWKHPITGQIRPSTLYLWVVALSGERKSFTDDLICGPICVHDEAALLKYDKENKAYKKDHPRWSRFNEGLLNRIAKLARTGASTDQADAELEAHAAKEPVKPRLNRLIRQDISHVSVCKALEGDGKAIALMTDEGQILLDSNVMRHIGVLNKIWDGTRLLTYDRADDTVIVQNPRTTISIMVQPNVLNKFLVKHGALTHGSGHWARYLIARSPSIQGFRPPTLSDHKRIDLVPFHARVAELLRAYLERAKTGSITRDVLEFDDAAKRLWVNIASKVEMDIQPGYYLHDIGDFASKYMDIVGRVATLLHYFEADTETFTADPQVRAAQIGKISADTLARAEEIAAWHLHEYKSVFSLDGQRSPEQIDADNVFGYLYRHYFQRECLEVSKNLVRRNCGVRGERYYRALDVLIAGSAISILPGRNNTQMIHLNPYVFSNNPL
jgi:hypothetical protein